MLDYDFECSILRWVYTYGVWCTASTVQAPRTRRTHCGQHRTDTGNVCLPAVWTVLHGACPQCERCCTVPARSVNGAARCLPAVWTVLHGACPQCEWCCTVPARGVFEHVQTHWNGWVYCFAWLHWRSNWVILDLLSCDFCKKKNICLFLFFNQYIFSCKLKIWNQFLAVCIEKSIFPKFFFFFFVVFL